MNSNHVSFYCLFELSGGKSQGICYSEVERAGIVDEGTTVVHDCKHANNSYSQVDQSMQDCHLEASIRVNYGRPGNLVSTISTCRMRERLFEEHLGSKESPDDPQYRHLEGRHEAPFSHLLLCCDGPLAQIQTVTVVSVREVVDVVACH